MKFLECTHYKQCDQCAIKFQPKDGWIGARVDIHLDNNRLSIPKPLADYLAEHDLLIGLIDKTKKKRKKKERKSMETPNNVDTVNEFLTALQKPHRSLTTWEKDFVTSITDQFASRGSLSDKQFQVLERIYAEKTA